MNYSLKKLNLAWNGLYYEGALAVRDALSTNKHLLEIDISNNRINWEGALLLAEMLEKNCYLEVLRVRTYPASTLYSSHSWLFYVSCFPCCSLKYILCSIVINSLEVSKLADATSDFSSSHNMKSH